MRVRAAHFGLGMPGAVLGGIAILSLAAVVTVYLVVYAPPSSQTVTSVTTSTTTIVQTSGGAINTANIAVTSVSFSSETTSAGSIVLSNTGTSSTYAEGVSLSYQGVTCTLSSASVTGTSSPIVGGSSQTITISVSTAGEFCDTTVASAGNAFNGYVFLSNGEQATFTGTFT